VRSDGFHTSRARDVVVAVFLETSILFLSFFSFFSPTIVGEIDLMEHVGWEGAGRVHLSAHTAAANHRDGGRHETRALTLAGGGARGGGGGGGGGFCGGDDADAADAAPRDEASSAAAARAAHAEFHVYALEVPRDDVAMRMSSLHS